jgi:Flp pilus assembly protein TadD
MDRTEKIDRQEAGRKHGEPVAPPVPGTFVLGRGWLPAAVILVAALLAYQNSFSGVFLFDDVHAIVENPYIRSLWPLSQAMSAPPQSTVSGRPLVSLTLAFNYALGGLNPRGYHAFNLLVHLLCGLLLFGVVRRTLMGERLRDRYGPAAPFLAGMIALLWVVHPLQTETVTYVVQRTEGLMGLFYLLTLYCFIRGCEAHRQGFWRVAAVAACALGMTCKEVMATAPLMVLLYDRVFVADSFRQIAGRRRGLYLGLAGTWAILVVLMVAGPRSASVGFSNGVSAFEYARNQCIAIITYLKLSFWPHPLVLDYGTPQNVSVAQAAPYAAALAVLLIATVVALIYRPRIGFLGAWFFVILAPTSSFVPIITEVTAERRVYLSLAAVITLVVLGAYGLVKRMTARGLGRRRSLGLAVSAMGVVAACVLGNLTYLRNAEYQNELTLWSDSLTVKPHNPRIHLSLGKALVAQGRLDEGIECYHRALQLDPALTDAHFNLGNALQNKGQFAEAVAEYEAALRIAPDYARVQMNLGVALVNLGRYQDSINEYQKMLRLDPNSAEIHGNLAVALLYGGRPDEAISHLREAVRLNPGDYSTHRNLAAILLQQGRVQEAVQAFQAALQINPNDPQIQAGLNEALAKMNNAAKE